MIKMNDLKNTYHNMSIDDLCLQFKISKNGLKQQEAINRLNVFGKNTLPTSKQLTAVVLLVRQFANPLVYILLFAIVLSFAMKHFSDGIIISLVVLVSGIVGFIQEFKANKALNELNSIISYRARVLRNGALKIIDQADIVPGDIIDICSGDIIPADARLITAHNLRISEAVLTGESIPSKKFIEELPLETSLADRDNMVFQGTAVSEGAGRAIVVATGANTEMGKIASMLRDAEDIVTPLQKQISSFSKWLSVFLVFVNVLIFVIGLFLGRPFFEMFMISVVVVVSAVPEGLVPAMSIVLALGMQKLIKKKGLVRKIISAETLGAVSVICTDKTGTLTEGEMSVESIITANEIFKVVKEPIDKKMCHTTKVAMKICVISNNAILDSNKSANAEMCVMGNATDKTMLQAGGYYGISREELEFQEKRLHEIPFSSESKIMATLHETDSLENVIYVKGAPEKILPLSKKILVEKNEIDLDANRIKEILKIIDELTNLGQRVIVVAYRRTKNNSISYKDLNKLVYVGLVVIKDKIRISAKKSIKLCQKAGVRVVMITGDHANTALSIANEVGITAHAKQVLTGQEIDDLTDEELQKRIKRTFIYARVEPRHKLKIVTFLQQNGEVVAMTGDGVNDAPALKKADIGIAMGNGTHVAKEVADLVLLDSSFMTIVEAIKQGRITFANIRKVVVYLFTDCFQEMVIIGTAVLAGWPLPILPVQVLWIKLIESPLPATSLSFEDSNHDVFLDKPRGQSAKLLTGDLKINIAFYAIVMDFIALSMFYFYWKNTDDISRARTLMFVALGMSTLFNIYNIRSLGESVFKVNPFKNKFLVIATIVGFLLFLLAVYSKFMNEILQTVPLSAKDWMMIFLYACLSLLVFETGKRITKFRISS